MMSNGLFFSPSFPLLSIKKYSRPFLFKRKPLPSMGLFCFLVHYNAAYNMELINEKFLQNREDTNKSQHLHNVQYVQGTLLSILQVLTHVVGTTGRNIVTWIYTKQVKQLAQRHTVDLVGVILLVVKFYFYVFIQSLD